MHVQGRERQADVGVCVSVVYDRRTARGLLENPRAGSVLVFASLCCTVLILTRLFFQACGDGLADVFVDEQPVLRPQGQRERHPALHIHHVRNNGLGVPRQSFRSGERGWTGEDRVADVTAGGDVFMY